MYKTFYLLIIFSLVIRADAELFDSSQILLNLKVHNNNKNNNNKTKLQKKLPKVHKTNKKSSKLELDMTVCYFINPQINKEYIKNNKSIQKLISRRKSLVCNLCHGIEDKMHLIKSDFIVSDVANIFHNKHPVYIVPSKHINKLPSDFPLEQGEITCFTCHDAKVKKKYSLRRGYEIEIFELCAICHDRGRGCQINPHINSWPYCFMCHKGKDYPDIGRDVEIIKLICIRCHGRTLHPAKSNHIVKPKMNVPIMFPLDNGEIICTTCHDLHFNQIIIEEDNVARIKLQTSESLRQLRRTSKDFRQLQISKSLRPGFKCDICHYNEYKLK